MKASRTNRIGVLTSTLVTVALMLGGCASSGGGNSAGEHSDGGSTPVTSANRYLADDGRTIEIGKATRAEGGLRYDNPHMEKGKCWVADGFTFAGYDTVYLAPAVSVAKFPDKPEDNMVHNLAKERLVQEVATKLAQRGLFANIVLRESDIKPGAKVLRFEQTITEFSKGGGAARYWVGIYGGGQPILRVQGKASEGDKSLFTFEARRSGVSGGARMMGAFIKDEDIQLEDIRSMVLDLTDFMAAVSGKYKAKN
jgi:hypothetical protein